MRRPQYISPTAYQKWKTAPEEYYIMYLADCRPEREPQTVPMAIGSAFDAYVKAEIAKVVFGTAPPELTFEYLFERGVEPQNRDKAREDGLITMNLYRSCGGLADLLTQIHSDVKMEFEVQGQIMVKTPEGLVLMGKPDLTFKNQHGQHIILDWKVNGAYSNSNVSPMKGYTAIRGPQGSLFKAHKECMPGLYNGIRINQATTLENLNDVWAAQLAIYAWLCGMPVGSDFVVMVDQLAGKLGQQRVAEHRLLIGRTFQTLLYNHLEEMWATIRSDHIFRDMSYEDSKSRCLLLDKMHEKLPDSEEDLFKSVKTNIFQGI